MSDITRLKAQLAELQNKIAVLENQHQDYAFSTDAVQNWKQINQIPETGHPSETVRQIIENNHLLDFKEALNTSSYVNIHLDKEEEAIALMGLKINLADQVVYPQSCRIHDTVVNMIAQLWHCPDDGSGNYPGAGTVGSTEACLLAGLALKFRWREWYKKHAKLTDQDARKIKPNLIISSCYQAAWEKLFKYIEIEPRIVTPSVHTFTLDPEHVRTAIDEKTIGVVCVLGNHYGGHYDPIASIDTMLTQFNTERSLQVGIHVDAASGGFIAPFQSTMPSWDFRLKNVLSISSSGHKYGESCCGTGWIVWRKKESLSEHVAVSVSYLGGNSDSYTLNFSRPASGVYVQYYKLLHYGIQGFQLCCNNMIQNAAYIREALNRMTIDGKQRFLCLDHGSENCLPVVTAMLNPDTGINYTSIDLQHTLSQHHWFVSGYKMGFEHPLTGEWTPLFSDMDANETMFRIVIKSHLTRSMANHLIASFTEALKLLDTLKSDSKSFDTMQLRHKDQRVQTRHC